MFCVFLQNIPPEQYSTISVTHNETVYTLSKELSLQNSELISDQAKNETNNPINLDYDHEYDDFQLISDLFNYKRVFITKLNIDFLEYSANYLKIPILIKKTIKFRNHYQDFLNNPIFEEIKSLHKQIFSICQQKNAYDEKDDFSDSDEENEDTQDEITEQKRDENKNSNKDVKSEVTSSNTNNDNDATSTTENNETKNTDDNNGSIQNSMTSENIQKIKYKPEYASTVSHIFFGACLADPLNIDTYLKIVANDAEICSHFHNLLSIDDGKIGDSQMNNILWKTLNVSCKNFFINNEKRLSLDTNLFKYFNFQYGPFFCAITEMKNLLEIFVNMIKDDDIDSLQQFFIADESPLKNLTIFTNLFRFSAILSAMKCFKYFLLNYSSLFPDFKFDANIVRSAIIGGNIEIFRLSLDRYGGEAIDFIKDSIIFNRTKILKWLITNDIQFLSIYNCSCSTVLYGVEYVRQKWYSCSNCHPEPGYGMCKFCAKHCHLNKDGEDVHNPEFQRISTGCFCDDDCPLSKNIEIIGNKRFVEIDDLILLSIYCLNVSALKVLIDEGAYILRCRDRITRNAYSFDDEKLKQLISGMRGYKDKYIDEINSQEYEKDHELLSLEQLMKRMLGRK
ncbi:hypothetical protein M9Y10_030179 [Tritrichomonas musculus]|uniref:UBR-type domain-containing protein n=1 Tax=Tritrichomonas musculus TaxID=1915356 RepID=A0ABR2KP96_9EUKA